MIKLKVKLALFNLLTKLVFTLLFLILMPYIIERINLRQVDKGLVQKREQMLDLISEVGIEPFMTSDSSDTFGSYNILKEEFISLEKVDLKEDLNYIEVANRLIEDESIEYRVLNYTFKVDDKMYLLEIGKSLSSITDARNNISKVIFVFLAFIIAITLLTDLQYTRYLLRPLDRITGKLKGISNPSAFDKSPVNTNTSDFYYLDKTLMELMEHIDELFTKEKEITVNISHELLTPISVIRSKLENLLLKENLDNEISEKVEESLKTLQRLHSLVNSLLFIARIESHQYLMEESFSVKDVLQGIIDEINPIAEDSGIIIKDKITDDFIFRGANRSLIFSMFYNVVNNAVKNSSEKGEVIIRGINNNGAYNVSISDTGNGMSETQMTTLFSRFKTRKETSEEGAGIGLAISKTIADLHNIRIDVKSEEKKGSLFAFYLS